MTMLRRYVKTTATYVSAVIVSIIFFFPIYWLFASSLKTEKDMFARVPLWIFQPTLMNYEHSLEWKTVYPHHLMNTLIVTAGATMLTLAVGMLPAYALARYRLKGRREDIAFWILSCRMFIPVVLILPYFLLYSTLNLLDTHIGLIILYTAMNVPFFIWIMRGIFLDLPRELEEAALVDGASELGALVRIVLPLALPGLAVTSLFCAVFSWNEFMFAYVLTGAKAGTAPVVIAQALPSSLEATRWDKFTVWAFLTAIPMLALGLFLQRYIAKTLTFGAVKG